MAYFFAYGFVSGGELAAWIMLQMGNPRMALFWVPIVGYYGTMFLYVLPPFLGLLHIMLSASSGGLDGESNVAHYTNDLILGAIIGSVIWIGTALIHWLFTERFLAHVETFIEVEDAEGAEDAEDDEGDQKSDEKKDADE